MTSKEITKKWKAEHIDRVREITNKGKKVYLQKPHHKISYDISSMIRKALNKRKNGRYWEILVGYSLDDLINHLESKFTDGMSWDNYGTLWHIDHVIPINLWRFETTDDREFKQCWALCNLQPLWAIDNHRKWKKTC